MKMYTLDKPMPDWLLEHRDEIYVDVLGSCEKKLLHLDEGAGVEIAFLKTPKGITRFIIKNQEGIIDSLERCMAYFVETEKYELAARSRDCIKSWKETNK